MPRWVTIAEAAVILGVHPRTIERRAKSGIYATKPGAAGHLLVELPDSGEVSQGIPQPHAEEVAQLQEALTHTQQERDHLVQERDALQRERGIIQEERDYLRQLAATQAVSIGELSKRLALPAPPGQVSDMIPQPDPAPAAPPVAPPVDTQPLEKPPRSWLGRFFKK